MESDEATSLIRRAAKDPRLTAARVSLAQLTSETFRRAGEVLQVSGHLLGPDRVNRRSPFGHGSDETVAVSLLLRIASELVSASADLFTDGRHYAASALLRQIVEIEYLAWAFETRDKDGERWLRSTKAERQSFFSPAKLRNAAGGQFRGKDYGYHCELGGHPVPGATALLQNDQAISQLLLSDLLGHTGQIWDHAAGWVRHNCYSELIFEMNEEMAKRYSEWKASDPLVELPPPPS